MALQVGEVIEKHNEQYEQIEFIQLSHKSHDRFLIIDDNIYLMGASLNESLRYYKVGDVCRDYIELTERIYAKEFKNK